MEPIKIIISIFVWLLGSCAGLLIGLLISKHTGIKGELSLVPPALGVLICAKVSGKLIARALYKGTERAVHGHPFITILNWLLMFVILAAGILFFGLKYLR
jgi:hypothetical protein